MQMQWIILQWKLFLFDLTLLLKILVIKLDLSGSTTNLHNKAAFIRQQAAFWRNQCNIRHMAIKILATYIWRSQSSRANNGTISYSNRIPDKEFFINKYIVLLHGNSAENDIVALRFRKGYILCIGDILIILWTKICYHRYRLQVRKYESDLVARRKLLAKVAESWGEWPSALRRCNQNWKVSGLKPFMCSTGLRHPTFLRGSRLPSGRNRQNAVIDIGLLRLFPREWPKIDRGTAK